MSPSILIYFKHSCNSNSIINTIELSMTYQYKFNQTFTVWTLTMKTNHFHIQNHGCQKVHSKFIGPEHGNNNSLLKVEEHKSMVTWDNKVIFPRDILLLRRHWARARASNPWEILFFSKPTLAIAHFKKAPIIRKWSITKLSGRCDLRF